MIDKINKPARSKAKADRKKWKNKIIIARDKLILEDKVPTPRDKLISKDKTLASRNKILVLEMKRIRLNIKY